MNTAAIFEHNHRALVRLVAALFLAVGLVPGGTVVSALPRDVRLRVLRVLRPAEAALRRLIVVAAQEIVVALRAKRAAPTRPIPKGDGSGTRAPLFPLFDPRKWFWELSKGRRFVAGPGPRISGFDDGSWTPYAPKIPAPKTEPDPKALCRRLQALHRALQDIPAQAKRLARVQFRRRAAGDSLRRTEPLRPGFPPGHRHHQRHEVDEILADCEMLARHAQANNTS